MLILGSLSGIVGLFRYFTILAGEAARELHPAWTSMGDFELRQSPGAKSFGTAILQHEKYQPWNAFQSQAVLKG